MRIYPDSSFVVKLYSLEKQSDVAIDQMESLVEGGDSILLGELTLTEVTNAINLGVVRRSFSRDEASTLLADLAENIRAGIFQTPLSPPGVWKLARELSRAHIATSGCRTLDILHVAHASLLNADLFLTFDSRQRDLAIAAGLNAPDLLSDHS